MDKQVSYKEMGYDSLICENLASSYLDLWIILQAEKVLLSSVVDIAILFVYLLLSI